MEFASSGADRAGRAPIGVCRGNTTATDRRLISVIAHHRCGSGSTSRPGDADAGLDKYTSYPQRGDSTCNYRLAILASTMKRENVQPQVPS